MKIASSTVEMSSSHVSLQKYDLKESLRTWIGNRRPDFEGMQRASLPASTPSAPVQISDIGKSTQSSEATAIQKSIDAVENDPMLRLIRAMIAALTGQDNRQVSGTATTCRLRC